MAVDGTVQESWLQKEGANLAACYSHSAHTAPSEQVGTHLINHHLVCILNFSNPSCIHVGCTVKSPEQRKKEISPT